MAKNVHTSFHGPAMKGLAFLFALAWLLPGRVANAAPFFTRSGSPQTSHIGGTATLLPTGQILAVGGGTAVCELYNPSTGSWTRTASMSTTRTDHTATLLPNGNVLVSGGAADRGTAEMYNPFLQTWTSAGSMRTNRTFHTATLLSNGKVLIAGGAGNAKPADRAEIYDPTTGNWSSAGIMLTNRFRHTATLLSDGRVLIAGGATGTPPVANNLASAEIFDPASGNWTGTGNLSLARTFAASLRLPNGTVLLCGGSNFGALSEVEIYDPSTELWTVANQMNSLRFNHTASILPNGLILVTGGSSASGTLASTELYNPTNGIWTTSAAMSDARTGHWAALMPSGRLIVGGGNSNFNYTEMYDPNDGTWFATGALIGARTAHTATLLANGKVLVTGGLNDTAGPLNSCELYNPSTGTWTGTSSMASPRYYHTATLLPNGKVLVVGGRDTTNTVTGIVELYDPNSDTWSNTASLNVPRGYHSATLMLNGKVLVAGGVGGSNLLSSTEVYDPQAGTWSFGGNLNAPRDFHPAQLLRSGKILIGNNYIASPEMYDPATRIWTTQNSPGSQQYISSALLSDGRMLICGGYDFSFNLSASAYTFDPNQGFWFSEPNMKVPRVSHRALTLRNGKCLVTGGYIGNGFTNSAELFDPSAVSNSSRWTLASAMATARESHTMTLLSDGTVLVVGGTGTNFSTLQSAEIFDPGPITNLGRPQINNPISAIDPGSKISLSGSGFVGLSESTGGNGFQSCAANFPLLQLINLETRLTVFLACTNWTDTSLTSIPLTGFPPGPALMTVYVNGIASLGSMTRVNVPAPAPPQLTGIQIATSNAFGFSFTNVSGSQFSVLATTNVSLPLSNWTAIGGVIESPIGQFQFTNSISASFPYRFFSVRSQ